MKNEIILYQADDISMRIEVRLDDETIWLTQTQIVSLFASSKANISEHIKNIFQTKELDKNSTVRNFRTVQMEGDRQVSRGLASLKDAGNKWFAFSELKMDAKDIIEKLD